MKRQQIAKQVCLWVTFFVVCAYSWQVMPLLAQENKKKQAIGPIFSKINSYIQSEIAEDRIPGLALVIVKGDKIVYAQGFGQTSDGHPVTPQTPFILGSMSKSFTALACMQLVETGKLDLDVPVQLYLPWFQVKSENASQKITVRHLLNQTSGLPTRAPFGKGKNLSLTVHVEALKTAKLLYPPGQKHIYSSPNYQILGLLIEQLSKIPYGVYVSTKIFAPLEMKHSFVSQIEARKNGMADGHRIWFGYPVASKLRYETDRMPTAALISSAEDLGHYLIALLNEGRYKKETLLSPNGLKELFTPAAEGDGFHYAMGWRVGAINGSIEAIHHGGIVPNFRGKIVILPKSNYALAVLTNVSSMFGGHSSHRIANGVASMLNGTVNPSLKSKFRKTYLFISLALLLIVASSIKDLVQLKTWYIKTSQEILSGKTTKKKITIGIFLETLWPLAILIGLPLFFKLPWTKLGLSAPDIYYCLIFSITIGLLVPLFKLVSINQSK